MNQPQDTDDLDILMSQVQDGDRDAYTKLFDTVAPMVYGITRRVLRDEAQAEEVTQEVMLAVWRTADKFDATRGSTRSWVATMAHRRAVDRVRSSQARRDREHVSGREEAPYDSVAEQVEDKADRQGVRDALDVLTPLQREAIDLAYYEGYTYREVAELLGAPLGTVKTRMRDGLQRLRGAMGGGS